MDHLHNWERQGYLAPSRIRVGKKQIRDYTGKEAHLIRLMWFYYQKGLSPRNAYRTATEDAANNAAAAFSVSKDQHEGREAQERKIDSLEGIAIFELAIPLRHYFHVKMSGKEREWNWRKAGSFA